MKQTRAASLIEACLNTASGFLISLIAQYLFLPLIGVPISFQQNLIFAIFMTFISVARSFAWRRLMEALHIRHPISPFMAATIAERRRQQDVEGWSAEHDDQHGAGELAQAGAAYATYFAAKYAGPDLDEVSIADAKRIWPWDDAWWKPTAPRRDLVKACALIVAEGEKFDRQRKPRI